MATTSELDTIYINQINEGLGAFCRLFESTRTELGYQILGFACLTLLKGEEDYLKFIYMRESFESFPCLINQALF